MFNRRTFLKVVGGTAAASAVSFPVFRALADPSQGANEFFVLIHASGGWDVTMCWDPRNETRGLVNPASTGNTDTSTLTRWVNQPLDATDQTFAIVRPSGSNLSFGPTLGSLTDLYDRLCVVNGLAMNTVSHPDGIVFSATGRHLGGGRAVASSVDTMLGNEFGLGQLLPVVSVQFPSSFVGQLDQRATPLRVGSIGTIAKSLSRSSDYDTSMDRDAVTAVLTQEATDLASRSYYPQTATGMALQFEGLRRMLNSNVQSVFSASALQTAYPEFAYRGRFQGGSAVNAAFAIEAMKRNVTRVVGFALGGLDTHNGNYRFHAANQQEIFEIIASLVRRLDMTPHPTVTGDRLSDHTHILVFSDFCRTPMINLANGRDHYPNNSALVISPKFQRNFVYGSTDPDQMLPANAGMFSDGVRPIAPPDLLATFVGAFGIDPRKYLRDGEIVHALLR